MCQTVLLGAEPKRPKLAGASAGWASCATTRAAANCDLGEGADDNLPGDMDLRSGPLSGYGAGATFDCTETACSPP